MVKSKDEGFEVKILQKLTENKASGDITTASYEPLREIISPLGIYVVAGQEQEFIIEIRATDMKVYGAKLYIDEQVYNKVNNINLSQEIYYKKTFKKRGFFMGFKLGEGRFQAFKFAPPSFENKGSFHDMMATKLTRSEIRIEFFTTIEKLVSNQSVLNKSFRKAHDEYKPGVVKENKKFFRKSLTVKAGEQIYKPNLDKESLLKRLMDEKTKKYKEHVIDYGNVLETITIHYGDFNSLLIQGVVSLANYDHLGTIPINEIKRKPKMVERVLMTIIRKHDQKGLSLPQIEEEFQRLLRKGFDALEVGPLVTFISLRHQLFQLDDRNNLKCSETAKNIYLDLRDISPNNGIIPPSYFKTPVENNIMNNKNNPAYRPYPTKPPGKENSSKSGPPIMIDLTQD